MEENIASQLQKIGSLLQDKTFAVTAAQAAEAAYYTSEKQPVPAFVSDEEKDKQVTHSFEDEKIATNIAGFYAVECCLNYLVATTGKSPKQLLQQLLNNELDEATMLLFARFANATWKAGQPFRSLDRITRATFKPFNLLTKEDIEKDIVQVKAAAQLLLTHL